MTSGQGGNRLAGPKDCYLGVDGGGTRVRAVVVDRHGREVGRGDAGSANPSAVGLEVAAANILRAVESAAREARITPPLAAAWVGLAGVDRAADRAAITPLLEGLAADLHITNDAELALMALPDRVGICLVVGTGSIVLGRDRLGSVQRAGGWGHIMGDEGSGYDLGRRALQAVAKAADGRGLGTALQGKVLRAFGLREAKELLSLVYPQTNKRLVAELAPLVFEAAAEGDAPAREIVQSAAGELTGAVLAVAGKLSFEGPLPLALSGGVLLGQPLFQEEVVSRLREHTEVEPVVLVHDPALAAARSLAKEQQIK